MASAQLSKNKFVFYIIPFLLMPPTIVSVTFTRPSVLRGGIVYSEEARQGPVYLNQDYMSFVRVADTKILETSAQTTKDFTTLYHIFCQNIAEQIGIFERQQSPKDQVNSADSEWETVFSPFKHHVNEAPAVCKSMGARLPEIRNKESYDRIRSDAIKQGVNKIAAGVYYDAPHKHFRFLSDDTNARTNSPFPHMTYGGDWKGRGIEANWESDSWLSGMAASYAVIYNNPRETFSIRLADSDDIWYWDTILCEKKRNTTTEVVSMENNMLTQLAHHNCQRDRRSIVASTQYLLAEIEAITSLNITLQERAPQMEEFFPQIVDAEPNAREPRSTTEAAQAEWDLEQTEFLALLEADEKQFLTPSLPTPLPDFVADLYAAWKQSTTALMENRSFLVWLQFQLESSYQRRAGIPIGSKNPKQEAPHFQFPMPSGQALTQLQNTSQSNSTMEDHSYDVEEYHATQKHFTKSIDKLTDQYLNFVIGNKSIIWSSMELTPLVNRHKRHVGRPRRSTLPANQQSKMPRFGSKIFQPFTTSTTARPSTSSVPTFPGLLYRKSRFRRAPFGPLGIGIAAGLGGLTMANAISSAVTGDAPMSWTGKILGGLFGFPTSQNSYHADLAKMAKGMESLKVNQDELVTIVNTMGARLSLYGELIRGTFQATATITMEQDLKMIIRHLQVIQQLTLAKYANLLMAAATHKTSPYALSQVELQKMADEVKLKNGLQLTRSIQSVLTTAAIVDNQITLFFEVPVIEESHLFNFYRVTPLPVFADNKTLIPVIDAQYIAISKSGSEYVTVSADQFTRCVTDPSTCQVSSPVSPMATGSSCVITTYTTQKLTCPLLEVKDKPEPVIHISGNRTFFSVPHETPLYIKCSDHAFSNVYEDASIIIKGMGEAVFRQSCTITLPGGTKFQTPSAPHTQQLTGLNMFELLRIFPVPTGVVIHRLPDFQPIKALSLEDVQIPTPDQLTVQAFHPFHSFPFLVQISVFLGLLLLLGLLIYCFRTKVKSALRFWSCGMCFNKETEAEKSKKRMAETDLLINKISEEFDLMRKNAAENMAKWKSTSQTYLGSFGKSKSSPNVALELEDSLLPPPPPSAPASPKSAHSVKMVYTPVTPILKRVQFDHPPIPPT